MTGIASGKGVDLDMTAAANVVKGRKQENCRIFGN